MALVVGVVGVAWAATIQCPPGGCSGTNHDDRILGTEESDNIQGFEGDDVVKGFGGSDNTLRGDAGRDTVYGGAGYDYVEGGSGKDDVRGGADGDSYFYSQRWGRERIVDTRIDPLPSLDVGNCARFDFVTDDLVIDLNSGKGPEVKNEGKTSTLNWADSLIDCIVDGTGDDLIVGRPVADKLHPFAGGVDTIIAGGGNDWVYAHKGIDTVYGEDGNDLIEVNDFKPGDVVHCGAGTDDVNADAGDFVDSDCEL